jgi:hypothetical protein
VTLIEELASPHHELLSAKKKKEKYDEIVQKFQSDKTANLNSAYQQKKAEYEYSVLKSSAPTSCHYCQVVSLISVLLG